MNNKTFGEKKYCFQNLFAGKWLLSLHPLALSLVLLGCHSSIGPIDQGDVGRSGRNYQQVQELLATISSAFHRYCNTPMSQCVVHFMCSGTLKCLIQHSSEPVYYKCFIHELLCVVHFIDTVILQ